MARHAQLAASAATPRSTEDEQRVLADIRSQLERAIVRSCPAQLRAHVDDIVQLAMLRVMRSMKGGQIEGEGIAAPPTSYLRKVAYTTMIDELRKAKARSQAHERSAEVEQVTRLEPLSPDTAAEGREIGVAIRACLRHLGPNRRRPVVLHLQGHSVPEISVVLQWTRKRAENQVYRGLAKLRSCLRSKGMEP